MDRFVVVNFILQKLFVFLDVVVFLLLLVANNVYVTMSPTGFDPPGEKWQLCFNIVVALPPKPPQLDFTTLVFVYLQSKSKVLNSITLNGLNLFIWEKA